MRFDELVCREVVELVSDYLEGSLAADDRDAFERHLVFCDGCEAYLEQLRETVRLAGTLAEQSVPDEVMDRLLEAFRAARR